MTTRFTGELPLDAVHTAHPEPSLLEVTQPFMPAIRDQAPEFAKRLSPGAPPPPAETGSRELPTERPAPHHGEPAAPAAAETTSPTQAPVAPPKRRSFARRVVRSILGPDLLRKDPKHR